MINEIMRKTFRHSTGFGKRIEYWLIGQMLKEGFDVYVPSHCDTAIIRKRTLYLVPGKAVNFKTAGTGRNLHHSS